MRQNSVDKRPASIAEIKSQLIARGNDFVQQQKLGFVTNARHTRKLLATDPLISDDPIQLSSVDYRNGSLIFTLTRSPNAEWLRHFREYGKF